jgi:alanine dehydrogenase
MQKNKKNNHKELLTLGVLARSRKQNERRLAIHPLHLEQIDTDLRQHIYLEYGYGKLFGVPDDQLSKLVAGLRTRDQLIAECDVILLPKPLAQDLRELRKGQVLWGWPHCVQNEDITQIAIDRRLTLIAFEAMHKWANDGSRVEHVFHQNNGMAGYCSLLHAMQIIGVTGEFYRPLSAAVIGYGATGRGAVTALNALGVKDVHALEIIDPSVSPKHSVRMVKFERDSDNPAKCYARDDGDRIPLANYLPEFDIVFNCVLQNPKSPLIFLTDKDLASFSPSSLIIDVSCDAGMGFSWARPTSFKHPMFTVGNNIHYYAVDHSPSLLWNSATWVISEALLPYLKTVLGGPEVWETDQVIKRAIEINDGVIRNPDIMSFQHRSPLYPHARLT